MSLWPRRKADILHFDRGEEGRGRMASWVADVQVRGTFRASS